MPEISAFSFIADIARPYPSRVCSSVFVKECNFRCPYCINRALVVGEKRYPVDFHALLNRLIIRRETAVVVSGGEPFLDPNINLVFEGIKNAGMLVAVATNGTFPDRLKEAGNCGLVDHVIMDIKSRLDIDSYSNVAGKRLSSKEFDGILDSIDYLANGPEYRPSHEFRTTVCSKYVSKQDLFSIASHVGYNNIYVLQPFTSHQTLDQSVATHDYSVPYEELEKWAKDISEKIFACFVREV
jgi:pyruvate formate lyase activating enzyme